jgi:CRP/FNR family transcriptional regulator, cyclic AMP receptor protein
MTAEEKADALSQVDLFRSLGHDALLELAEDADERHYQSDEVLYSEGDPANELWVVARGGVALSVASGDGDERILDTRRAPAAFGEAALYDEGPRMVSARAVEDTDVLVLQGGRFRELVRSEPDVAEALLRLMAAVIRASAERRQRRRELGGGPGRRLT